MIVRPSFRRLSAVVWACLNGAPEDSPVEHRRISGRQFSVEKGGLVRMELKPNGSVIPLCPTWSHLARLPGWSTKWREWFPFNDRTGTWTFSGPVALYHGVATLNLPPPSPVLVPSDHQAVGIHAHQAAGPRLRYSPVNAPARRVARG